MSLLSNGNLTVMINNGIAAIHQNTYLIGSIANQLSGCVFIVLCRTTDKDLAVFLTIKCPALFYTYAGNAAVWRTVYGYIDNTAGFIGCRGIIIYAKCVVVMRVALIGIAGKVDDAIIFEVAAIGCINSGRQRVVVIFICLPGLGCVVIIRCKKTTGNYTVVDCCTTCITYGQTVETAGQLRTFLNHCFTTVFCQHAATVT